MKLHPIIQGGMGIAISNWKLARTVAQHGQLGVVSSTAIDLVMVRTLQDGDPGGHLRRAFAAFPDQAIVSKVLDRYFIENGKPADQPYANKPMIGDKPSRFSQGMIVLANFAEVWLAKEGHQGSVGVNFLHKIQPPIPAAIYGAMLAGADLIIVGAGIPLEIPSVIDALCRCEPATMSLHVHDATKGKEHWMTFDPRGLFENDVIPASRPAFFPIVSSFTLASLMVKKCPGKIDGLIIEEPSAGGHNAPPRGKMQLNERGEPLYGPRDAIDLDAIKSLGVPFWLAGSYASPTRLLEAQAAGAVGVQLGTAFAFCQESGLRPDLKQDIIQLCEQGEAHVFKDPVASPTGFPFQVLELSNTLSEAEVYANRCRQCDLGYLREPYERTDGSIGWRCKAEDSDEYVRKGGKREDTIGRKCLCNSLMANIGMGQRRDSGCVEPALITCGEDLSTISYLARRHAGRYSATQVVDLLLG